jgi:hypothetical protein
MVNLMKGLIVLAGLGFVFAVIGTYITSPILGVTAEGFSRGCTNLALIAIALSLTFKEKSSTP